MKKMLSSPLFPIQITRNWENEMYAQRMTIVSNRLPRSCNASGNAISPRGVNRARIASMRSAKLIAAVACPIITSSPNTLEYQCGSRDAIQSIAAIEIVMKQKTKPDPLRIRARAGRRGLLDESWLKELARSRQAQNDQIEK